MMFYQEQLVIRNANTTLGVLFVMGSAFSYSLYILFAKPSIQSMGSRRFTSLAMIGSTVFVLVHFAATARPSELLKLPSVIYIYATVLAFVCTVVPSYMINEAIARIGASRTTVVGAAGPVLTMALAIIVLQETTSLQGIAGMLVTIAGVSLVAKK